MPHYENAQIGLVFDLPDEPTVSQIVGYDSRRFQLDELPGFLILWECVKPLIKDWQFEPMPDPMIALDKITGKAAVKAAQAVEFAAFRGVDWRTGLDDVPKNS